MVLLLEKTDAHWEHPRIFTNKKIFYRDKYYVQDIFFSLWCLGVPVVGLNKSRQAINFITVTSELTIL